MAELLPCPSCGYKAEYCWSEGSGGRHEWVSCSCGMCSENLETWNRRVPYLPTEDVETLRAVVVALDYYSHEEGSTLGRTMAEQQSRLRAILARLEPKP